MNHNYKRYSALTALMAAMTMSRSTGAPTGPLPGAHVTSGSPWDRINLTKAERKGKTYDEIQAMRRERWEAARGQA